jgi:hypothetical protein
MGPEKLGILSNNAHKLFPFSAFDGQRFTVLGKVVILFGGIRVLAFGFPPIG